MDNNKIEWTKLSDIKSFDNNPEQLLFCLKSKGDSGDISLIILICLCVLISVLYKVYSKGE